MKPSELIPGSYYVGYWGDSGKNTPCVIFLFSGDLKGRNHYLNINTKYSCGPCCTGDGISFRDATMEEINMLYRHINTKPQINETYELF